MSSGPLTQRDCLRAAQLHQNAFFKGWSEQDFLEFLENPLVYGLKIEDNHELSGYILWREVTDEAEILTLVIAPAQQRKGRAGHLLETLFELLKKKSIKNLFLEVAEDNVIAQSFYKNHGFYFLSKRKNYYSRKEGQSISALNFSKHLA